MRLLSSLRRLRRAEDGVTAVETAFIMPVLLFGLMMLFELAHIALVIGAGNLALEHAVQRFREQPNFYELDAGTMELQIAERMQERSFGLFDTEELRVDVLPFDNLQRFGEAQYGGSQASAEDDEDGVSAAPVDTVNSPPILSVTVDLQQSFMTALPALFGLGEGYQYQYRHLLGNLPSGLGEEESQ